MGTKRTFQYNDRCLSAAAMTHSVSTTSQNRWRLGRLRRKRSAAA
jgi:hypothetical protein